MTLNKRVLLSCLLGLALAACTDDDDAAQTRTPVVDSGTSVAPAAPSDAATPNVEDGSAPVSKAIPLIDWVDDLLDHHTNDESSPDTVDDKNIADNEDPATFDNRFVN